MMPEAFLSVWLNSMAAWQRLCIAAFYGFAVPPANSGRAVILEFPARGGRRVA